MKNFLTAILASLIFAAAGASAAETAIVDHSQMMDHGDGHLMDMEGGMVMGQNKDKLPAGCDRVSEDVKIEVHAGHKYSKQYPGTIFGFDQHEWKVKPCTRLTVTLINEDNIRHQWMMHGLPKLLYDKGMFHLEVTGPGKVTGTLILPPEDKTYLVHCDIAQHMEKGMKGELIVGKGSGTFPSIPGITDPAIPDDYGIVGGKPAKAPVTPSAPAPASKSDAAVPAPAASVPATAGGESSGFFSGSLVLGLLIGFIGAPFLFKQIKERCQGMTYADAFSCALRLLGDLMAWIAKYLAWLLRVVTGKEKFLPKQ